MSIWALMIPGVIILFYILQMVERMHKYQVDRKVESEIEIERLKQKGFTERQRIGQKSE